MKTILYQCPVCKTIFTSRLTNPHCIENNEYTCWTDLVKIGELILDK